MEEFKDYEKSREIFNDRKRSESFSIVFFRIISCASLFLNVKVSLIVVLQLGLTLVVVAHRICNQH